MARRFGVPLAPLNTLKLGGLAATMHILTDARDMVELSAEVPPAEDAWPVALGGGSNVLVADAGVSRPVLLVRTGGIAYQPLPDGRILARVQAGHALQDFVDDTVALELSGLETLTGIPGTVGAVPVQNVGAYGQEVADTLVTVTAWDWRLRRRVTLRRRDCRLGHRTSIFKHSRRWLILEVAFALRPGRLGTPVTYGQVARTLGVPLGARVPLPDLAAAVLHVRRTKGMVLADAGVDARSAGSVFLSPTVDAGTAVRLRRSGASVHRFPDGVTRASASWLMEAAGYRLGDEVTPGVRMSTRQFTLVAEHRATTESFVEATRTVQARVLRRVGVRMPPELDAIGTLPAYERLLDLEPLEVAGSSQ